MKIPLGTSSYESASKPFSAQRCVNLYAVVAREQSLNETALFGTPGIVQFGTTGSLATYSGRGAVVMAGVYYSVQGGSLYSFDSAGAETLIGTIEGVNRVSMAHNGLVLCIVVPGGKAYTYTAATTTLAEITDVDYTTSDTVNFKDGYFIFTETDGTNWFVSALNDPSSIDALDFGSAELNPDKIIASHVNYDEVYIFGEVTTEVFQNIGGAGFPFQRVQGASYEKGCHSKYSPVEWEGALYFLGGGENEKTSVYKGGTNSEPQKVSTDAIDNAIQKFTTSEIAEAFSFTYSVGGYSFVGFTFRSILIDSRTFIYNVTASNLTGTNIWFEQQTGLSDNAWRIETIDNVYDKLIVSDTIDGRIGYLSTTTYTEYGATILREKVTPPISNNDESIFMSRLELTVDSGQGLINGQGSDPQVMLDWSDDGARTWGNELWRPLGKIGEYIRKAIWWQLGRTPAHRVWRFRITDPIKVVLIKLEARLTIGT